MNHRKAPFSHHQKKLLNQLMQAVRVNALGLITPKNRTPTAAPVIPSIAAKVVIPTIILSPLEIFARTLEEKFRTLELEIAHRQKVIDKVTKESAGKVLPEHLRLPIDPVTIETNLKRLEARIAELKVLSLNKSDIDLAKHESKILALENQSVRPREILQAIQSLHEAICEFESLVKEQSSRNNYDLLKNVQTSLNYLYTHIKHNQEEPKAVLHSDFNPVNPLSSVLNKSLVRFGESNTASVDPAPLDSTLMKAEEVAQVLAEMREKQHIYKPQDWYARLKELTRRSGAVDLIESFKKDLTIVHHWFSEIQKKLSPIITLTKTVASPTDTSGLRQIRKSFFEAGSQLKSSFKSMFNHLSGWKLRLTDAAAKLVGEAKAKAESYVLNEFWRDNPIVKQMQEVFQNIDRKIAGLGIAPSHGGLKIKV